MWVETPNNAKASASFFVFVFKLLGASLGGLPRPVLAKPDGLDGVPSESCGIERGCALPGVSLIQITYKRTVQITATS